MREDAKPQYGKQAVEELYERFKGDEREVDTEVQITEVLCQAVVDSRVLRVWRERKKCYRRYKEMRTMGDEVKWKKARALTTRTFKAAKRDS